MMNEAAGDSSLYAPLNRTTPTAFDRDNTRRLSVLHGKRSDACRWKPNERFHHLFESIVDAMGWRKAKAAVAVEYADASYSFAELEAMSNRLARYILKHNVEPGDRVAVMFDRTIHAYASLLAISKVGAAFVPLDVGFPLDRIRYILEDSGASCVLTLSFYTQQFADPAWSVLALDASEDEIARLSAKRLSVPNTDSADDGLAYIIYTSGTTGRPKGVPTRHSSIVNFLRVAGETYGYRRDDRVYQSLTLAFDYAFEEIWVPLLSGARLVPAPPGVNLLGSDLAAYLRSNRITAYCCVPTVLATIDDELPDLRLLITSGEACSASLAERWIRAGRRILNVYGPTETTVSATWCELKRGKSITIGEPLDTYTVLILDPEQSRVLPQGEVGELAIAGIGVAEGYLHRNEETTKAFIDDFIGLTCHGSGRIYRSGDLARLNGDNAIEYIGRKDTQVKIRGFRIELGEIEAVACDVAGIDGIVVDAIEIEKGERELVAYYVQPSSGRRLDPCALHEGLRERLPAFMVPVYYEELEAIPRMPSSKVDRHALPRPSTSRLTDTGKRFLKPKAGMEKSLAELLGSVLKVEKISADADFFTDLGANSLLMARYLGRVRKTLGLKGASMRQIYENTNVVSLAAALAPSQPTIIEVNASPDNTTEVGTERLPSDHCSSPSRGADQTPALALSSGTGSTASANPAGFETVLSMGDSNRAASRLQFALCGVYQFAYMLLMAFVIACGVGVAYRHLSSATTLLETYLHALEAGLLFFTGVSALQIIIKWALIGRFKEENIPLWSGRYARLWIARMAIRTNPLNLFIGTPLYNVYLRLLGANIGTGTFIFSPPPVCTDLLFIGNNTLIRQDCRMTGYTVSRGTVYLGSICIGNNCHVSEATTFDINTSMGDNAQLGTSSALRPGQHIPEGEVYQGCPAESSKTDFIRVPPLSSWKWRPHAYVGMQAIAMFFIALPVPICALYLFVKFGIVGEQGAAGLTVARNGLSGLAGYAALVYLAIILLAQLRVLIMPRLYNWLFVPDRTHRLFSFQYFLAQRITASSNSPMLQRMFGDSALIMPYYKGLGYNLKTATQNGSNFGVEQRQHSPFLCKFNRNTLVSDGLALLNLDISTTSFRMAGIEMPSDAYLGNDLHFPVGARIGENCLVATKAFVPVDGPIRTDVGLLGSPVFEIPRSVARDGRFDHYKQPGVFEQRLRMKLKSNLFTLSIYLFRNWSGIFFVLLGSMALASVHVNAISESALAAALFLVAIEMGTLILIPLYFLLYERAANWYTPMKPRICSLYERPFWDHERFWKLDIQQLFAPFNGTPFMPLLLRLQGVEVGRQVYADGVGISEPFLTKIGDYSCLNAGSTLQGHSLEDGTFKSDRIRVGNRSTLAIQAFVHYGTDIGDDTIVETDAFVMKGSVVADDEIWLGNPARGIVESNTDARVA